MAEPTPEPKEIVVFDSRMLENQEKVVALVEAAYWYSRSMKNVNQIPNHQEMVMGLFVQLENAIRPFLGNDNVPKGKSTWK